MDEYDAAKERGMRQRASRNKFRGRDWKTHSGGRCRSESPPPKRHRTRKGINRGSAGACPFCRPHISQRMQRTAVMRHQLRADNVATRKHGAHALDGEEPQALPPPSPPPRR